MRFWEVMGVLVLVVGCAPRLVHEVSPEHPRWDVPFGRAFPEGTRGMVVARDTLWVGPLVAREGGLQVADRTFALSEVDCVAYRLPRSYMPWQIGVQSGLTTALGVGVMMGTVIGLLWPSSCGSEPAPSDSDTLFSSAAEVVLAPLDWGCGLARAMAVIILAPIVEMGFLMAWWGYHYPERRLWKALHRYTLRRDPAGRDRCAEILHFYHPLLEEDPHRLLLRKGRDFQAIPLDF